MEQIDALGDEIAQLAGQIAAATARFLTLLGQFDAAGGWGGVGIRSLPHWLSWRAGMSLRTARDHVRVARALRDLPLISAAFERGELSFSKVRALTRVTTRETEPELLAMALNAPAAHVERVVAGLRKVRPDRSDGHPDTNGDADTGGDADTNGDSEGGDGSENDTEERPGHEPGQDDHPIPDLGRRRQNRPADAPVQRLQWRWDEEKDELVVWGRFGAADGKVLLAALTRAELERIRTVAHDPEPGAAQGEVPELADTVDRTAPPPLQAGPALIALAQIGLSAQEAPTHAPAAEVIFLHQVTGTGQGCSAEHSEQHTQQAEPRSSGPRSGVVSADDGPALDHLAGQEVLCDADSRCVAQGADGAVLAYGRKRRGFSSSQMRALHLRDRACRTPGCQRTRFLHAHHVDWFSRGGPTDLDNAVLLCSACHRAVHLGRLQVRRLGGQRFEFTDGRTGEVLVEAPPMFGLADQILADRTILPRTITGGWWGEPLDLSETTASLIAQWKARGAWPGPPDAPPRAWDDPPRPRWTTETAA